MLLEGKTMRLNEEQIKAYYHRSYTAVDGLWFMKVEDKYGFEKALEMDNAVWQIMPKIQARMLKSMLNCGENIDGYIIGMARYCNKRNIDMSQSIFLSHYAVKGAPDA